MPERAADRGARIPNRIVYLSNHLFPYFFNMLSEGENRQIQSRMLHIDEDDDFGILLATAQMDTLGAVTVKPIDNGKD